ncbi:hypothetical protein ACFTWH_10455 [Streptomyces sp. NPDC057011]|uniref:hypothetical protein n=1 Tax=unclassified Streptomyces TaxID=2593676 RepID=UPI003632935D
MLKIIQSRNIADCKHPSSHIRGPLLAAGPGQGTALARGDRAAGIRLSDDSWMSAAGDMTCQWSATRGLSVGIDVVGVDGAEAVLDGVGQDGVALGGDGEVSRVDEAGNGIGPRAAPAGANGAVVPGLVEDFGVEVAEDVVLEGPAV